MSLCQEPKAGLKRQSRIQGISLTWQCLPLMVFFWRSGMGEINEADKPNACTAAVMNSSFNRHTKRRPQYRLQCKFDKLLLVDYERFVGGGLRQQWDGSSG